MEVTVLPPLFNWKLKLENVFGTLLLYGCKNEIGK
jgi:hypothetical protein